MRVWPAGRGGVGTARRRRATQALVPLLLLGAAPAAGQAPRTEPADTLDDAGAHHLFLAPTGRTHPRGTRTGGLFAYIFPYVGYAVTDGLHLGGGIPMWVFSGEHFTPFLTPKLRLYRSGALHAAVGSLSWLSFETGNPDFEPGVGYGVLSADLGRAALTGGVARGFGELHSDVFGFAGFEAVLTRGSKGEAIKLLGEVFGFPADEAYFLDGRATGAVTLRFSGPRAAFDAAVAWTRDVHSLEFLPLPLVGFTFTF